LEYLQEKYQSNLRFYLTKAKRFLLRLLLRRLIRWRPIEDAEDGYSLVIGVACPLEKILQANLALLCKQDRTDLGQIIVVCDRSRQQMSWPIERTMRDAYPQLPLRFVYWSRWQRRMVDLLCFPWIDAWLSWCMGIAHVKTRYAMLHDLDAMLLRPTILCERYQAILNGEESYVGARFYEANGITAEDGFVVTFELIFDAQMVRRELVPIDLFNHVCRYQGRRVELDTFLHAQTKIGAACMVSVNSEDMVHPSQLFCQFNDLRRRREYILPSTNNLPLIPYFLFLAGEPGVLSRHRSAFDTSQDGQVEFFNMTMDASFLTHKHLRWLKKQVERLELAIIGRLRPEVEAYFDSIAKFIDRRDHKVEAKTSGRMTASAQGSRD
jgi:hypothetical protein